MEALSSPSSHFTRCPVLDVIIMMSTCVGVCERVSPCFQAYTYTREQVIEMMEFLIECGPPQLHWEPVELFYKLSCVELMLQLISTACDWRTYYGR